MFIFNHVNDSKEIKFNYTCLRKHLPAKYKSVSITDTLLKSIRFYLKLMSLLIEIILTTIHLLTTLLQTMQEKQLLFSFAHHDNENYFEIFIN